eukprot:TRINITY_DN12202_c0_g2_i1.p1 TRINITY_DN12202_c0_g2~~TRINITY_DN12202_c0_g2_i1.p1  ORF type:complete len:274 (-),score=61.84 TRINITY_DN12202_c0_g2_i1:555-1304(-)
MDPLLQNPPEEREEATGSNKTSFGLLVVVGIIISWVGSTEFANYAEKYEHYDKPFFIVYLNNSWNVFLLPLFLFFQFLSNKIHHKPQQTLVQNITLSFGQDQMTTKKLLMAAAISTFNLCVADYFYFRALSITSASSGIVIFNLSSIVTYFLSIFLLKEAFSFVKVFAVLLSFGGAALIVLSDEKSRNTTDTSKEWVGDLVMTGGACFWGIYLVIYKKFIGDPGLFTINLQSTLSMIKKEEGKKNSLAK